MEFVPEKNEAFIVTREIHAGGKKIPLGSIGCFAEGKRSLGRIVDQKSRPAVALMSNYIKPLNRHQAAILLSVESPQKRYSLFHSEQLFSSICYLKIHDVVQLRCGRVLTTGVVRGFWERLRHPGNGVLKMVLIEVELLDPSIIALSNSFPRLKIDASKINAVSSSITISPCCQEIDETSHKKEGLILNLAENNTGTAWPHEALLRMPGAMKGIQGLCNSCYLDTTLFSLFSFSSALDGVLDSAEVHDATAQQILRQQIVKPLRQHGYVGAESVMDLRRRLRSDSFITEEKDPEEFLNVLLGEVLAIEPLLKIKAGNQVLEYNCYQILVERDGTVQMPTVQQLLDESLLSYDLKFAEIPSCLILQMPRFGKRFKTFSSVYPSLELDLTGLVDHDVLYMRWASNIWMLMVPPGFPPDEPKPHGIIEEHYWEGNEKGSYIPVVKTCPQLGHYLAMSPEQVSAVDIKQMDELSRQFFCDSYTFMYQQPKFNSSFRN